MHDGVKGRLKDMGLVDIIQVLHIGRKTALINVGSSEGAGKIWVENGDIVHAQARGLSNADAVYRLLGWKEGEFEVDMDVVSEQKGISAGTEALLIEGMRRLDETKRGGKENEAFFGAGEKESLHLIERLIKLGILVKKEG